MKNILVVAVHPDDETLGCGGTLLKHKNAGANIHWMICTELRSDPMFYKKRVQQIETVEKYYGFSSVHNLELNAMQVDEYSMSQLVDKVSIVIQEVQPDTIYLPFKGDVHSDHRVMFQAVYSCTKSFRHPYIKKILMMETLSETEFAPATKEDSFIPNVFVDISDYVEKKKDILNVYEGEMGKHPFPRNTKVVEALALFRGATAGCEYAESFMLLKDIS